MTQQICTKEEPMIKDEGRWLHPDAKAIDSESNYWQRYECPNCKLRFKVELPD